MKHLAALVCLVACSSAADSPDRPADAVRWPLPAPNPRAYTGSLPWEMDQIRDTESKLESIRLPLVDFEGATLGDAVKFLREKSRELDRATGPRDGRGVNFVLLPSEKELPKVTLMLHEASLGIALKATCDLAGVPYRIGSDAVTIGTPPPGARATRTFPAGSDFLTLGGDAGDPFGQPAPTQNNAPKIEGKSDSERARGLLKQAGIPLRDDDGVEFNAVTGRLTVSAADETLEMVAQFVLTCDCKVTHTLACRLEIYRVPDARAMEIAGKLEGSQDATAEIAALRKDVNDGKAVRLEHSAALVTRSGQRSKLCREPASAAGVGARLSWELEPTLGPDGAGLDVTVALDYADTESKLTCTTASTMMEGDTVLIGSAGNGAGEAVMAFLRVSTARVR